MKDVYPNVVYTTFLWMSCQLLLAQYILLQGSKRYPMAFLIEIKFQFKVNQPIYYLSFTFSIKSMVACKSAPNDIVSQTIPSLVYSACSKTNIKLLKNCWSLSFVKLMQICSKPLYFWINYKFLYKIYKKQNKFFFLFTSKVSNPAISRTPMKWALLRSLTSNVTFTTSTNQAKARENTALLKAPTEFVTWSLFWPLLTNSLPTFVFFRLIYIWIVINEKNSS